MFRIDAEVGAQPIGRAGVHVRRFVEGLRLEAGGEIELQSKDDKQNGNCRQEPSARQGSPGK